MNTSFSSRTGFFKLFKILAVILTASVVYTPINLKAQISKMKAKQLRINGVGNVGSAYADNIDEQRTGGSFGLEYCTSNNQSIGLNIGFATVKETEDKTAILGEGMNELHLEYLFKTSLMQELTENIYLSMVFGGEIINIKSDNDFEMSGASFIAGPILNLGVEKFLSFIPVPLTFANQFKVGVFRGTVQYPHVKTEKINTFYSRLAVDTGFILPFSSNFNGLILYHGSLIGAQYAESAVSVGISVGLGGE